MSLTERTVPYQGTRPPRLAEVPAFVAGIGQGWADVRTEPPLVPGAAQAGADHRRRLSEALPGRTLVARAGRAPVRANDTSYDFRPDSDFAWLTGGVAVEDAVLVMVPTGSGHDATLYLPPPLGPGLPGFFANAASGELWVGPSPSLAVWEQALGLRVRALDDLDPAVAADEEQQRVCARLRMVKDAWEVGQLREAVDATVDGFAATVAELPRAVGEPGRPGLGERWLQGTFDRHCRTFGNQPGYATIVGSGPHAPTLHWVRCDGPVLPDAPLLLDMGVEGRAFYTADVTRTVPPSGRFDDVQRRVHDLEEAAHRAGMAAVRPGALFSDFHFAAMEVVATGLHEWGLLDVSVDEALSPQGQQHRRWLVCGIGHHLGLDVHDCSATAPASHQEMVLEPGMVLTVEPGLYFHAHDLTVPPELRGIGVRLEDDLLVTPTGAEVLSDRLPIDAAGVERWTQQQLISSM
ncbi:M24 family metallopeptidase [Desertihabitans brevis]|uniref:Xaa-Pro aminopeptidase n=1 Tax=Desertihabitans brevis TaxID=2268447 RepID=A0A367YSD3_9ACTN|nr:aminopeptidase P family protein [Desertihabitans brevis]RCK68795.1 M24 family metallopeptidase [Desertihabitans brevis]